MRIIGHLDMDAFFAAVEERDNPRFAGRPIVVGADPRGGRGRGVVSTANYKAREYGIRSALPIMTAWKNAEAARLAGKPAVIFIEGHYEKYGDVSRRIMEILAKYSEHIEQASVDEAYFDLSDDGVASGNKAASAADLYAAAEKTARQIKADILAREHLTASIGIGPNKLIAKIASDRQKPNGLTVVREEDAEEFLAPLSLRAIPGIGPKTEAQFKAKKVFTVGEARRFSAAELKAMMGKWGPELYEKLRGRSDAPLVESWEAKSIGEQKTFARDVADPKFLNKALKDLAAEVHGRFLKSGFAAFRTVVLTVRFADFETKTRTSTLAKPVNDLESLQFQSLRLFMPFFDARENPKRKNIRLLGVRVEKFS